MLYYARKETTMSDIKYVVEFCPMTMEDYCTDGRLVVSLPVNTILSNLGIAKSEEHKYIVASTPHKALDKAKELLIDAMSSLGYDAIKETLNSIIFANYDYDDTIWFYNGKVIIPPS